MNSVLRQGLLPTAMRGSRFLGSATCRYATSKDQPPLCSEPPQPPCCPNPVEPPPCPPPPPPCGPPCPPSAADFIPNPCNYVPPGPDSDEPDLTKFKEYQCRLMKEIGVPTYLQKSTNGPLKYYISLGLLGITTMLSIRACYELLTTD